MNKDKSGTRDTKSSGFAVWSWDLKNLAGETHNQDVIHVLYAQLIGTDEH